MSVPGRCMKYKKFKDLRFWVTIKNLRDFCFIVTIKLFSNFSIWLSQFGAFLTTDVHNHWTAWISHLPPFNHQLKFLVFILFGILSVKRQFNFLWVCRYRNTSWRYFGLVIFFLTQLNTPNFSVTHPGIFINIPRYLFTVHRDFLEHSTESSQTFPRIFSNISRTFSNIYRNLLERSPESSWTFPKNNHWNIKIKMFPQIL